MVFMNSVNSPQLQNQNLDLSSLANNFAKPKELELAFSHLHQAEHFTQKHIDRCIEKIVCKFHNELLIFNKVPCEDIDKALFKILQEACLLRKKFTLFDQSFSAKELQSFHSYFKNATHLGFKKCLFTHKSFRVFPVFTTLETLKLPYSEGIEFAAVRKIASLPCLTTLSLKGTTLDDSALAELSRMGNLTSLDVSHTEITDRGLQALRPPKLSTLNIACTQIRMYKVLGLPFQQKILCGVTTQGFLNVIARNNLKTIDAFGLFLSEKAINFAKTKNITVITTRYGKSFTDISWANSGSRKEKGNLTLEMKGIDFSKSPQLLSDCISLVITQGLNELAHFLSALNKEISQASIECLRLVNCNQVHKDFILEKEHIEILAKYLPQIKRISFERHEKTFTRYEPMAMSLEAFCALKEFPNLQELNLAGYVYDIDNTLEFGLALASLGRLEELNLAGSAISEHTLLGILQCEKLQYLNIYGCTKISEKTLYEFASQHKTLMKLEISVGHNISAETISKINQIKPQLEIVITKDSCYHDRAVSRMLSLISISVEKLKENPLFDEYLEYNAGMVNSLDITPRTSDTKEMIRYKVTNENLRELADQFPSLLQLNFTGAIFEDGCTREFKNFTKLQKLILTDTSITLEQDNRNLNSPTNEQNAVQKKVSENGQESSNEQAPAFSIRIEDENGVIKQLS
jgi:hypothetical protein